MHASVNLDSRDVFISHASEDKATVAAPLAEALKRRGVRVWLDRDELTLGDSLFQKLDEGLKNSRFGVIILSRTYFDKYWTRAELGALEAKQKYVKTILPVLHGIDDQELLKRSPLLADLIHTNTSIGIDQVADAIVAAAAKAKAAAKHPSVAVDVSHHQPNWYGFVPSVRAVLQEDVFELTATTAESLAEVEVLVLALGHHTEFSDDEISAIRDWVQAGGGLFLLGFYLANFHHFTNVGSFGRAFGFSFRNDIVMQPGRTSRRECQDQGFDTTGSFAVPVDVPAGDNHPICRGVRRVSILSACSLDWITAPEYKLSVPASSAIIVEANYRPDAKGYALQIFDYVPSSRTEPAILAAWQYGKGRVVAAGAWKIFTLDKDDNVRLAKNVVSWLRERKKGQRI